MQYPLSVRIITQDPQKIDNDMKSGLDEDLETYILKEESYEELLQYICHIIVNKIIVKMTKLTEQVEVHS